MEDPLRTYIHTWHVHTYLAEVRVNPCGSTVLTTYLSCTYLLKMGVLWPQGQHGIPWKQGSGMEKHFPWNFHGFHGKFSMDTTSSTN